MPESLNKLKNDYWLPTVLNWKLSRIVREIKHKVISTKIVEDFFL